MQQEDCTLSDLASSCEYLTAEKTCSAVAESQKAQASRQLRCQNDEKAICCYICPSRRECTVNCKYLGATQSETTPPSEEKTEAESTADIEKTVEASQTKNSPVTCSLCNVDMLQSRTKFRIDGWNSMQSKPSGDSAELDLPVTVYMCPCCGKIELKAEKS